MSPSASKPSEIPEDPKKAPDLLVEAALFSAGEPLDLDDIVSKTRLSRSTVEDELETLSHRYEDRRTSFVVTRSGDKWAMALRERFADESRHIVPPEIPIHVLRTLALVAYHQPLLQSDLKEMVGSKVYSHVGILREQGLIEREREGVTYALRTTPQFPEYFGIPTDEPERIRRYLAERVGLLSGAAAPQTEDGEARDAPPVPGTHPG